MNTKLVVGYLFSDDGRYVCLLRKNRPEFLNGKLRPPGGHVEVGETTLMAVRREFREETGVDVPDWTDFLTLYTGDVEITHFYAYSSDLLLKTKTITDEEVFVFEVSKIINGTPNVLPNVRWSIPMALSFRHEERADGFEVREIAA